MNLLREDAPSGYDSNFKIGKHMASILHFFERLWLVLVIILPTGCLSNFNLAHSATELSSAYSPYKMSAKNYLSQAAHSDDRQKRTYQLLAAGRYLSDGDTENARQLLTQINTMDAQQNAEKLILSAKLHLLKQHAAICIETLAQVNDVESLDLYYQCEYHELLALAYQTQNQISEAALQRMKLDVLLTTTDSQLSNRQKMWGLMQSMPPAEINSQLIEAEPGSIWRGWLQLAQMMRNNNFNEQWPQWETQFPNHPALAIVKKPSHWALSTSVSLNHPKKIALLLPLSGSLSGPGNAVKEGFMEAYQAHHDNAEVMVYDSAKGVVTQYHRAIDEGAEVVVGPLTKPDATGVAATYTSTPTLLLNDVSRSLSSSKFAFGYSPKDEATQLADTFHEKAYHRVMMIVPNNAWGQEVSTAFASEAFKQGLQITNTISYSQGQNMSQLIRHSLGYQEHKTKDRRGRDTLEMKRRQDIDVIFVLAYPSVARQIIPLLKYYDAQDIPVYATSAAYAADYNPSLDRDLDGMYFLDIPWVFNHQIGHRNWPEPWNAYSRLYALGYDSYSLIEDWQTLQSMPQSGLSKQTGVLYIMPNGHIRRELALGQIRQGVAKEA